MKFLSKRLSLTPLTSNSLLAKLFNSDLKQTSLIGKGKDSIEQELLQWVIWLEMPQPLCPGLCMNGIGLACSPPGYSRVWAG